MAENEVKSAFAQEQVAEKSESERIRERIQNYKAQIDPKILSVVPALLESQLKAGLVKSNELEALIVVRDEFNKASIDYNSELERAQRRLQELAETELAAKQEELAKREAVKEQELVNERVARKTAEQELKIALAKLEALQGVQSNVTSIDVEPPALAPAPTPAPEPKSKSKAWEMIRAGRSQKQEEESEFKLFEPEEFTLDVPEDAKGTEEFLKEVESVQSEAEVKPAVKDEDMAAAHDLIDEELTDLGEDLPTLKVAEEDEETKPTFSGPAITGGNAPNLKVQIEENKTIEARLDKPIKSYDSLEDLQAAVDEKNKLREQFEETLEDDEEYDEIVIPSESELKSMTKKSIAETADALNFEGIVTSLTKEEMISKFVQATEDYIQSLQDAGEFIAASETDVKDGSDDSDDHRDGGYF